MAGLASISAPTLAFLSGIVLGAVLVGLWYRARVTLLLDRLKRSQAQASSEELRRENERLRIELAQVSAEHRADAGRLAWIESAEDELRARFEALANQVLRQSSQEMLTRSNEQLESQHGKLRFLVEPVSRALDELGGEVRELEKERKGAYEGLRQEIQLLRRAHGELQRTAVGLEQALKSSQARGRWGEVQLRRVVEMAGMVEHVDFVEQPTVQGLRPDMIVHLAGRGVLPVDAKAPMTAFLEAAAASDDGERRRHLDDHLRALRQRTSELAQRRYWEQFETAPDFVVMFLPNEACLAGAFERDPDFLDFAQRQRVLPATPVTLLALLKSVAYGLRQQQVADNARRIALAGGELHERLSRFLEHLKRLSKGLDAAVLGYNQALGSLERRVLPAARRLEETGAASDPLPEVEPVERQPRTPVVAAKVERLERQ